MKTPAQAQTPAKTQAKALRRLRLLGSLGCVVALASCGRETVVGEGAPPAPAPESAPPVVSGDAADLGGDSLYQLSSNWRTQDEDEIALDALKGQVQVMAMGYSTCKFACPRLVADMKAIEAKLPEELRSRVGFVFVSIDPGTDTPGQLKAYAAEQAFTPGRWRLLNGTEDAVLELSVLLGMKYSHISATDFAHSNIITVLDPGGAIVHQQQGLGADDTATLAAIVRATKG